MLPVRVGGDGMTYAIGDPDGKLLRKLEREINPVNRIRDTPTNRKKAVRIKYRLERKQKDYYIRLTTYNYMPGRFAADPSLASIVPGVCRRVIPRGGRYLVHCYQQPWEPDKGLQGLRREPTPEQQLESEKNYRDLGWIT